MKFASRGEAGLLVLTLASELSYTGFPSETFALPIMSRAGGLLLAIPQLAMDADVLIQAMQAEDADLVGPNKSLEAPLFEEEEGIIRKVKDACRFFLVDFSDEVLSMLRDFDASNDQVESLVPYDADHPYGIIGTDGLAEKARVWASGSSVAARAGFYSAREEPEEPVLAAPKRPPKKLTHAMLLEKIEVLQAQVASLSVPPVSQSQAAPAIHVDEPPSGIALATPKIPALANGLRGPVGGVQGSLSKAAAIVGPLRKVRASVLRLRETPPTGMPEDEPKDPFENQPVDPMVQAVLQQGSALSALIAHVASDSVEPVVLKLYDISSTKGVQKRERMMASLSDGSSQFFLQLQQQLHRRMMPSAPVPQTENELQAAQLSMLVYLERLGGYKGQRSLGMTMWLLAHCVDSAARRPTCLPRALSAPQLA